MVPQFLQGSFTDFFTSTCLPVLEEVFRSDIERHPQIRDVIMKTVQHDREIWQYTELHDMPLFSSVSEGTDYTLSAQKQGYDKTLNIVKYGLGFSISEEAVEDGKFPFIQDAVSKLAKSARETQEQSGMDLLNNGFSSTLTADGVALFATNHPIQASSSYTIANKPATNVDLSFSSLSDALSEFKKAFKGSTGILQMIMPKYLVVPTELEMYARQLVQSSLEADSNNNNINPYHMQLQVIASPHLTDADAWFLLADSSSHGLRIINRKGIETKAGGSDIGFLNDSIIYKARYREAVGALFPNGAYGSPGA